MAAGNPGAPRPPGSSHSEEPGLPRPRPPGGLGRDSATGRDGPQMPSCNFRPPGCRQTPFPGALRPPRRPPGRSSGHSTRAAAQFIKRPTHKGPFSPGQLAGSRQEPGRLGGSPRLPGPGHEPVPLSAVRIRKLARAAGAPGLCCWTRDPGLPLPGLGARPGPSLTPADLRWAALRSGHLCPAQGPGLPPASRQRPHGRRGRGAGRGAELPLPPQPPVTRTRPAAPSPPGTQPAPGAAQASGTAHWNPGQRSSPKAQRWVPGPSACGHRGTGQE